MARAMSVIPCHPPTIRVALVEDDAAFRSAFAAAIAQAGDLQLQGVAVNLQEAMALLAQPAPDVLVVDLGLPDGNGIAVIRGAHVAWPACNVMVSTAFGDEAHVLGAIEAGASGYVLKDSSSADLAAEIRTLHAGGSPVSPLIARRLLTRLQVPTPGVARAAEPGATLSPRETQVLELVAKGFTYEEIAARMEISRHTVLTFVRRIYAKFEVNSKIEAVNEARRQGVLPR